jgi:two-component system, NarL family, invasion response regulator UvrY
MNVLIVDDHSVIRDGVRRLLFSNTDISVCEASSSSDALAIYRSQRPDVVLLDLNLGSSSGIEFLRRLLEEDAGARVLIFSMYSEPIDVLRTLKAGASGYISKGADPASYLPQSGASRRAVDTSNRRSPWIGTLITRWSG